MTDKQRLHKLCVALLMLAGWYAGDAGPEEPRDKVRAYLATFPEGQRVLALEEAEQLYSERSLLDSLKEN